MTDRLRQQLTATTGEVVRNALARLGAWESMATRIAEGWPPDGWYPAAYYREDLESRDELAAITATMPQPANGEFIEAASEVDQRFATATDDDSGQALTAETGPAPASRPASGDAWWWHRITHPLPWQNEPGRRRP